MAIKKAIGRFKGMGFLGFGLLLLLAPTSALAQVALEDRSHLWPESASQVYNGIIGATLGVLLFLLLIFGLFFFLIRRKTKSKPILFSYSILFAGWIAYLYADTFASVDEFLRLCETKAGFHGQVIPKGSVLLVSENLRFGCGSDCKTALRYEGNVSYVEGTSTHTNFIPGPKKILYAPGLYRVTIQDGDSAYCQGVSEYQINDAPITIYPLPKKHCFHFERIEKLTAEYSVRRVYLGGFIKAKNIFGQLTEIKNIGTGEILATDGQFSFHPGKIDQLNLSRIAMDGVTIANCWDTSGSFIKMWGIKE